VGLGNEKTMGREFSDYFLAEGKPWS